MSDRAPTVPSQLSPDELSDLAVQPIATHWQRRWLSFSLSILLTIMSLCTAASLLILYTQASRINTPNTASDFLTIYQANNAIIKLDEAARALLSDSLDDEDFQMRLDIAASILIPQAGAPRNSTPFIDEIPENRQIKNLIANLLNSWLAHVANAKQIHETAQSVIDNKEYALRLIEQLAMAVHVANSDARDGARLNQYASFHQLIWTLGGLVVGCLILAVWLVRLNRLAARLNHNLSAVNIRLEAAVIRRTRQLAWLASTDSLTSLKNRRAFIEAGEQLIAEQQRHGLGLAALVLDIDHFKRINDLHGHHVGDQAIRRVAEAMSSALRDTDAIGRIGGEEFAVLMPQTSRKTAGIVAERIRQTVAALKIGVIEGGPLQMTISIGVAAADMQMSLDTLLMRADSALYRAKVAGRNRIEFAHSVHGAADIENPV